MHSSAGNLHYRCSNILPGVLSVTHISGGIQGFPGFPGFATNLCVSGFRGFATDCGCLLYMPGVRRLS
jgi:hypothetical protein